MPTQQLDVEAAVNARYSDASGACESELCCPVDYDTQLLEVIPEDVIARDYGCGDPSRYAVTGDTVLDLGSGGGKICFMLSQVVGPTGRVIGVDMNDEMLALARRSQSVVADRIGHNNVTFHKAKIQDLAQDLDTHNTLLSSHPVTDAAGLDAADRQAAWLRTQAPMIPDNSVDLVVSNCVLNLVRDEDKHTLIQEVFRVLKKGGRIAISDIVSDEPIPADLKADPKLWSGCISGAFQERGFLSALEAAGFHGIEITEWSDAPWQTVNGIEFRAVVVSAHKGKQGPCMEANQAVLYKGPWRSVSDDDGHTYERGVRTAVCAKTHDLLMRAPYADQLISIAPRVSVEPDDRPVFDCSRDRQRDPRETKGLDYQATIQATASCGTDECC
jgi:SAM-dependent methyltransferase